MARFMINNKGEVVHTDLKVLDAHIRHVENELLRVKNKAYTKKQCVRKLAQLESAELPAIEHALLYTQQSIDGLKKILANRKVQP